MKGLHVGEFIIFKMFIFQYITDADFHWRLSKCTYQLAQIEGGKGNTDKKKEMLYTAKDIAERALHLNQKSANSHKWYILFLLFSFNQIKINFMINTIQCFRILF